MYEGVVEVSINKYNGLNQLVNTTNIKDGTRTFASYVYNGDGLRTQKTVDGVTTDYVYSGSYIVAETGKTYLRGLSYHSFMQDNETYYYFCNAHGDTTGVVDINGSREAIYDYDEFGNLTFEYERFDNDLLYAGEFFDNESENYYLRSRYYDPAVGRFTQQDSFLGVDSNPLSLNRYTYCHNNPIMYIDPLGLWATYSGGHKIDGLPDQMTDEQKMALNTNLMYLDYGEIGLNDFWQALYNVGIKTNVSAYGDPNGARYNSAKHYSYYEDSLTGSGYSEFLDVDDVVDTNMGESLIYQMSTDEEIGILPIFRSSAGSKFIYASDAADILGYEINGTYVRLSDILAWTTDANFDANTGMSNKMLIYDTFNFDVKSGTEDVVIGVGRDIRNVGIYYTTVGAYSIVYSFVDIEGSIADKNVRELIYDANGNVIGEKNVQGATYREATIMGMEEGWSAEWYSEKESKYKNTHTRVFDKSSYDKRSTAYGGIRTSVIIEDPLVYNSTQNSQINTMASHASFMQGFAGGEIHMFSGDSRSEYTSIAYSFNEYKVVAAHEFGHILGIGDMYLDKVNNIASANDKLLPVSIMNDHRKLIVYDDPSEQHIHAESIDFEMLEEVQKGKTIWLNSGRWKVTNWDTPEGLKILKLYWSDKK